MTPSPLAVEVWRGATVESRHRVAVAVVETGGYVRHRVGDVDVPVFSRSALKPLQALPLIETGAADAFGLGAEQIALACASHGGEPMHTERVADWLARIDCTAHDLECGVHAPSHGPTAQAMAARGERPTSLHNNCSGKHAGMLTTARHLGEATAGYIGAQHPVQRRIAAVVEELAKTRLPAPGIDGCGVPNWPLGLTSLAKALAASLERGEAAARIRAAMQAYPELVAGTGRLCTALMRAVPEVVCKTGAEGVFVAMLPVQRLALALKVEDGAGRAAEVALLAILERLLEGPMPDALAAFRTPTITNVAGVPVGRIAPAQGWPRF